MDVFKTLILDTPDSLDNISGVLPVVNGGTGADNAPDARDNLGLGTMSTQDANAVAITGGSVTGLTSLGVVDNATLGSSNTDTVTFNARIASEFTPATDNTYDLGRVGHEWRDLYIDGTANIDSLVADTAGINGGTIDDTTIGATTPAAGTFSQVNSTGAIIATGAGSFGDDTDVTGDLDVTGAISSTGVISAGGGIEIGDDSSYLYDSGTGAVTLRLGASGPYGSFLTNSGSFMLDGPSGILGLGTAGVRRATIGSTGNFGIGIASPTATLHVEGSGASRKLLINDTDTATSGYQQMMALQHSGTDMVSVTTGPFTTIAFPEGEAIFSASGNSNQLLLDGSGNVGIGTASSPSTKLHVQTATNGGIVVNDGTVNGIIYGSTTLTNSFAVGTTSNHPLIFGTNNSFPQMTLATSGNVGVGSSAPTAKFVVAGGGAAIQGNGFPSTGAGWEFYTDTTTGSWAQSYSRTSSAWLDANWNALTHKYSTSGAERMRINSAGDVLVNGTTGIGNGKLMVYGIPDSRVAIQTYQGATTTQGAIWFNNPNGNVGTITTNGSATAYNTSSDYRLKENVVPMSDALQRISKLKPSRFNFIADDSVVVDGFIAHEVQEVVPEAISGEKDAMRDEEYEVSPAVLDDDGNEVTPAVMGTRSVPEYQGIDQSKLVPLLVGAIQELTARLEALENN